MWCQQMLDYCQMSAPMSFKSLSHWWFPWPCWNLGVWSWSLLNQVSSQWLLLSECAAETTHCQSCTEVPDRLSCSSRIVLPPTMLATPFSCCRWRCWNSLDLISGRQTAPTLIQWTIKFGVWRKRQFTRLQSVTWLIWKNTSLKHGQASASQSLAVLLQASHCMGVNLSICSSFQMHSQLS